ncbi:MAG TPA: LysR substrate-binding domain-containing protein [Jatrophihabitans sp.]|nr:LysR substrate-binding domain-containing protein [Jatrophihabitans sp.]
MDLLQLRHFQAAARHEHISRAAEQLRVAQPSLSRSVARLEGELGVPLFDRHGRNVRLNRFGAAFLRRVDAALRELDDGVREVLDAGGGTAGVVTVAAENLRMLTEVLGDFLTEHPAVRFQLSQSSAPQMRQQLESGEIDLCLASQPMPGPALARREVSSEEVLLAVPPQHPLRARRTVRLAELAGEPFVTTRPGYWPRELADRVFGAAGVQVTVSCEGDDPAALRGLISAGLGIGLLPASARQASTQPPVRWLRIRDADCHRTLWFAWRGTGYLSGAAREFRDFATRRLRAGMTAHSA